MKICVTMVGVCRPSFERIKQNIDANISYFSNTYKQHEFTFVVLSYINKYHEELSKFCSDKGIQSYFIEPLEEKNFLYKPKHPNPYRMFYSMEYILNKIPKNLYDCIVRLRLDIEVKSFELVNVMNPIKYYTINEAGRCSDNIGYASYEVMKKVWQVNNYRINGFNVEEVLYKIINKYKFYVNHFKFHYILYQSDDPIYDGFQQYSRRSREWIYDGINYKNNNI